MKQLSEREAWLNLAAQWKSATRCSMAGLPVRYATSYGHYGLCDGIDHLREHGRINWNMFHKMNRRIHTLAVRRRLAFLFVWSLGGHGRLARIRFCQRMARQLKRRRRPMRLLTHAQRCARIIATWPKWKQNIISNRRR